MACEPKLLARPNEPLCRVILVPLDGIAVVHGELVVEIVVPFTNCDKGGNEVVARTVLVIEWCLTQPMSERIHAERGLYALG
jgi:hypothetical protein